MIYLMTAVEYVYGIYMGTNFLSRICFEEEQFDLFLNNEMSLTHLLFSQVFLHLDEYL